jgi:hypothetical protein
LRIAAATHGDRLGLVAREERPQRGKVDVGHVIGVCILHWLATTPYLTATSQWLPDPAQIVTDFTFARAPSDVPYQRVLYDDSYLIPGDIGALLILLLVAGAAWLVVRLVRRPRRGSETG